MRFFLGTCILVFVITYLQVYSTLSSRLPREALDDILLPLLPIAAFTLIVLIAFSFVVAQLERIERRLDDREP